MEVGKSNSHDLGQSVWNNMEKQMFDSSRNSLTISSWVKMTSLKFQVNNSVYRSVKIPVEHSINPMEWR